MTKENKRRQRRPPTQVEVEVRAVELRAQGYAPLVLSQLFMQEDAGKVAGWLNKRGVKVVRGWVTEPRQQASWMLLPKQGPLAGLKTIETLRADDIVKPARWVPEWVIPMLNLRNEHLRGQVIRYILDRRPSFADELLTTWRLGDPQAIELLCTETIKRRPWPKALRA